MALPFLVVVCSVPLPSYSHPPPLSLTLSLSLQENHQRVLLEEKRRKREEARKAAAEKKAAKLAAAGASGGSQQEPVEEEGEGCIIDNLLKEIRSGTTLRPTQRKATVRAPKLSSKELEQLKKTIAAVGDSSAPQLAETAKEGEGAKVNGDEGGVQPVATPTAQKPHPLTEARRPVVNGDESTAEVVSTETTVTSDNMPSLDVAKETTVVNGNGHLHEVVTETTEVKSKTAPPTGTVSTETPVVNGNEPSLEVAPPTTRSEVTKKEENGSGEGERGREREEGGRREAERSLSPLERRLRTSCSPDRDTREQVSLYNIYQNYSGYFSRGNILVKVVILAISWKYFRGRAVCLLFWVHARGVFRG